MMQQKCEGAPKGYFMEHFFFLGSTSSPSHENCISLPNMKGNFVFMEVGLKYKELRAMFLMMS